MTPEQQLEMQDHLAAITPMPALEVANIRHGTVDRVDHFKCGCWRQFFGAGWPGEAYDCPTHQVWIRERLAEMRRWKDERGLE